MPTYELWVEHSPGSGIFAGFEDSIEDLDGLRQALGVPLDRCVVHILDMGVPSNYLPELEILSLSELMERGEACECGCGCGQRGEAFTPNT